MGERSREVAGIRGKQHFKFVLHADGLPHTKPLLMFRGKQGPGDVGARQEIKKYPKGIHVIFNEKAYANGENLKQWARQQYKWGSAFSPSDNEPRLLALDAFSAHKSRRLQRDKGSRRTLLRS